MDYLFNSWIYPLVLSHSKKQFRKTQLEIDVEIDTRFALVPGWTGMRWFREGIVSQTHPWTCHEMKDMMRQAVGCLVGLCPTEGISLIRDYLHIHRLSHYTVHTEEFLAWVEDAIVTFSNHLRAPAGTFARTMYNSGDCEPQRLHYFRHYAESVREKGALPSYSTDRTEIWHKWLKESWERNNKGEDSMEYILREHTRRNAFQEILDSFAMGESDAGGKDQDGATGKGTVASGEDITLDEEGGIRFIKERCAYDCLAKGPSKVVACGSSGYHGRVAGVAWNSACFDATLQKAELDFGFGQCRSRCASKSSNSRYTIPSKLVTPTGCLVRLCLLRPPPPAVEFFHGSAPSGIYPPIAKAVSI
jgi:hypothetical protein